MGIVAEVFTENVDAASVFCVILDADVQFNGSSVIDMQIVEADFICNKSIIHKYAVIIDGYFFEQTELCTRERPIRRGVFAASAAEISRRCESGNFFVVDVNGNVGWPIVVIVDCFGTNFKGKSNFGQSLLSGKIGGEIIRNKPRIEPKTFGFHSVGSKKAIGIIESADRAFRAEHAARRFDMAM